jgi:hypothetical protein
MPEEQARYSARPIYRLRPGRAIGAVTRAPAPRPPDRARLIAALRLARPVLLRALRADLEGSGEAYGEVALVLGEVDDA